MVRQQDQYYSECQHFSHHAGSATLKSVVCIWSYPVSADVGSKDYVIFFFFFKRISITFTQTETSSWYKAAEAAAAQKISLISRLNPKKETVTGVQVWRWAPAC